MKTVIWNVATFYKESKFEPFGYELSFGDGNLPPIEITLENGRKVRLVGKIDRVDIMQTEKESETSNFDTTSDDVIHFDEQKAALELERNDLIAGFDDTIKNSTNEAEKKNAVSQKEKITGYMEQEISIESIIQSKNLPQSMVIITDNTITVTVNEQDLKQNIVAKITISN